LLCVFRIHLDGVSNQPKDGLTVGNGSDDEADSVAGFRDGASDAHNHKTTEAILVDKHNSSKSAVRNVVLRRKYTQKVRQQKMTNIHCKSNAYGRRLICSRCGVELFTVARLHAHVKLCSSKALQVYSCHICRETFVSKLLHRSHVCNQRTSTVQSDFACLTCGLTFNTGSRLRQHQFVRHSAERPFVCDICGKIYRFRKSLSDHVMSAHGGRLRDGDKRWLCDLCGKSFALSTALRRHTDRIHLNHRPHVCRECGKQCSTAHQLRDHVASKHAADGDGRPYICSTCGAGFTFNCNLIRHAKLHSIATVHTCSFCSRNFRHRQNLTVHKRIFHSDNSRDEMSTNAERRICSTCGKMFRTDASLIRHTSIHAATEADTQQEGQSLHAHKCKVCGKHFSHARSLANHSVVHRAKQIQCSFCPRKFALQSHCVAHYNKKHTSMQASMSLIQSSCTNSISISVVENCSRDLARLSSIS